MSLHNHKPNHRCPRCTSIFLPYKKGMQCPNCGMAVEDDDTEEYLDAIELIAGSMKIHKMEHGTYFPGAWLTSNIMDHIQGIIYRIFDSMEEEKPKDEKQYLMNLLEKKFNWGEQQYLNPHIKDIVSEIFEIYKAKNFSEIKRFKLDNIENEDDLALDNVSKMKLLEKWKKTKRWFRKFLP